MARRVLTAEQETELRRRWDAGAEIKELAAEFGVHRQTIRRALFERGDAQWRPARVTAPPRGWKLSAETRRRQSAALRRYWESRRMEQQGLVEGGG